MAVFFDVELGLGGPIPTDGVSAVVLVSSPREDACEEIQPAPDPSKFGNSTKRFVLTRRFGCSFLLKVRS